MIGEEIELLGYNIIAVLAVIWIVLTIFTYLCGYC